MANKTDDMSKLILKKEVNDIVKNRQSTVEKIITKFAQEETDVSDLAEQIENQLNSNLKQLFYEEEIADVLVDYERSAEVNCRFLKECCRVAKIVGKTAMVEYIKSLVVIERDPQVEDMIEKAFGSNLKELLVKQELAEIKSKFLMCNAAVRKEWNSLTSVIDEIDLLRYSLPIVKEYRNHGGQTK